MLEAYGRFVLFKSDQEEPRSGTVVSVGEDVKEFIVGSIIYFSDYAAFHLDEHKGYFVVNREHILAVENP